MVATVSVSMTGIRPSTIFYALREREHKKRKAPTSLAKGLSGCHSTEKPLYAATNIHNPLIDTSGNALHVNSVIASAVIFSEGKDNDRRIIR